MGRNERLPRAKETTITKTYETSDITLAAALVCNEHSIAEIKQSGRWVSFIFKETPALTEDVGSYINRKLLVEPSAFIDSRNTLRGYIPATERD